MQEVNQRLSSFCDFEKEHFATLEQDELMLGEKHGWMPWS